METNSIEIIDIMSREGLKRVQATNMELQAKVQHLALELEKLRNQSSEITQTPGQDKLLKALSLAKADMCAGGIERSGHIVNRGSYATLDDIREFVDPILTKHGLSFRIDPIEKGSDDLIRSTLGHESGQWTSSTCRLKPDYSKGGDALQAYGKALTSMKRYIYGAVFMLHTGGDKD